MAGTGFIYHPDYLRHNTGSGHPERSERLQALVRHLAGTDFYSELAHITPEPAADELIRTVHPQSYLDFVQNSCETRLQYLDSDTVVCEHSYRSALLAVGGVVTACRAVMAGKVANAFCVVRPPGHHAEPERAMGFCLINNVAVAARYLQRQAGIQRVCIIDWDVHHGNGTQAVFYNDPSVLYISLHQHPLYPGTGATDERGLDEGTGYNRNFPLPAGTGDDEYIRILESQISRGVAEFKPDFLLLSAGFDAHHQDPLAKMLVTEAGFSEMTRLVKEMAAEHCGGRLVSALEGGYHLEALSASVENHLRVLLDF